MARTDDDRKTVKRFFALDALLSCKQVWDLKRGCEPREDWGNLNRGSLRSQLAPQIYVPRDTQVGEPACNKANALLVLEGLF